MSGLAEKIAEDVLRASGSSLKNYTMNGSRERIVAAASVADELLEALTSLLRQTRDPDPIHPSWRNSRERAARAIARATS